jgi:hypothetical protein
METTNDPIDEEHVAAVFSAARSLDVSIPIAAVRRFVSEVAEMDAALQTVAAEDAPLMSGYTPDWSAESPS